MRPARPPLLLIGAIAMLAAVAGVACDPDSSGDETDAATEPAYTEAVIGTWQRVNPLFAHANPVDAALSRLVFAGLTSLGPDGTVEPDLASEWAVSDDGLTYRFTLRAGLQWQDGTPLTSGDIEFTIDQITSDTYRGDPTLAELWRPVQVETPDNRTIVFTLDQPYAPFLARATTVGILPEHLLAGMTGDQLFDAEFNALPVGSGPYRLESLNLNEATLTAYERYHFGMPELTRLRLVFVPDARSALQLGDSLDGLFAADPVGQNIDTVADERDDLDAPTQLESTFHVLYLNNLTVPFNEPNIRKAISLAIDREAIVEEAMGGYGVASASPITPGTWAYDEEYDGSGPDVDAAESLLKSSGYERNPSTGILTRDGAELAFTLRTDSDPVRIAIAEAIASQLRSIGMRVNVASTSFAVLRDDFLRPRRYEAALASWDQSPDPDAYDAWHSSQTGPEGTNYANARDRRIDALLEEARTDNGTAIRMDFYRQFQDVWQDTVPSVIVAYPQSVYLGASGLDREVPGVLFGFGDRFANVETWHR